MLTALWRKHRWPDFVLLGGISRDSLFLVSSVMMVNRLVSSERLTQVCGRQAPHAPKCHYTVSVVEMLIYFTGSHLISSSADVMCSNFLVFVIIIINNNESLFHQKIKLHILCYNNTEDWLTVLAYHTRPSQTTAQ